MTLRIKIIVAFVLCIVLAFLPLLAIMNTQVRGMNREQAERQALQLIDAKAVEIGSWLNQRISEMRIIHQYPPCKDLDFASLKPYLSELNNVLRNQYGNPFETFAIGGLDGKGWVNDSLIIDISSRDYFQAAMEGNREYIISKPVVSKSDNKPIFLICYPILNREGEKVGFINGSVNLERISAICRDIDVYNGFSWVMGRSADIYSTTQAYLTTHYISPKDLDSLVTRIHKDASGILALPTVQGTNATVFYSSVPYAEDWVLCTIVEDSSLNAQTNNVINLILAVCVVLLGCSCLAAVLLAGSIVKPIDALKRQMAEVSAGNLDAYYLPPAKGELAVLGNTFNHMVSEIKALLECVVQVQTQKRTAELQALQSQINPHFLYNTLDTLQWKALEHNAYEVADMVNALSGLFRIALSDGKEFITLGDELQHVRNYLEIQKIRYQDKMSYAITEDFAAQPFLVPKLIIQPLVENAIYHGLKPLPHGGKIDVSVAAKDEFIFIVVQDSGIGIAPDRLAEVRANLARTTPCNHYGLYNIAERLRLAFGELCSVNIQSQMQQGTSVTLKIPIVREGFQCFEPSLPTTKKPSETDSNG